MYIYIYIYKKIYIYIYLTRCVSQVHMDDVEQRRSQAYSSAHSVRTLSVYMCIYSTCSLYLFYIQSVNINSQLIYVVYIYSLYINLYVQYMQQRAGMEGARSYLQG